MPTDPTISLNIAPLAPPQGGAAAGPLDMIGRFADIQNALNQNLLFQQTLRARQRMGQIVAQSPDTESALLALQKDPIAAPFAGEYMNYLRQAELAQVQMGGEIQKQSSSAFEAALKTLPQVLAGGDFDKIMAGQLATVSPYARNNAAAAISLLKSSLYSDLPGDPDQARKILAHRIVGASLGAGIPPDALNRITGPTFMQDTGGQIASGVQLPAELGGQAFQTGAMPKTLAPQVVQGQGPGGEAQTKVVGGGLGLPPGSTSGPSEGPAKPSIDLIHPPAGGTNPLSPSSGSLLFSGPNLEKQAALTSAGKSLGDINSEMQDTASHFTGDIKRLDLMHDALTHFQAGGGADIRSNVGQFLQALKNAGFKGITDQKINEVANSSLPWGQLFDAQVKPLVISELKSAAQGTGRVMRSEVDAFLGMMSKNTDPRALVAMLDQARYNLKVAYDKTQKWPAFKKMVDSGNLPPNVADYGDFDGWYTSHFNPKNLPQTNLGGFPLGPEGTKGVLGAEGAPQKAVGRFNPKTGKIEYYGKTP